MEAAMAEYVLWQLKNVHLGEGVEMVQMATLPHMEPANVEQWTLLGPGVNPNWRTGMDLKAKGYSVWETLTKNAARRERWYDKKAS
jgi:hypothetical protein